MKGSGAVVAAASLLASTVSAADLAPIVIKGSRFFNSQTGAQFFIKGVAYQEDYTGGGAGSTNGGSSTEGGVTYTDPLSLPSACQRDIPYLQKLDTNVIRVYAINPQANHDSCMSQLADAGIYVFADLSAPVTGQSINQDDPAWNDQLYARYTSVIDAMAKYTNVIGFFAGNEVSNQPNNTNTMPFVKAAVRDTKAYINATASRPLYVGYAADDDASIRVPVSEFMICGDDADAVDFWGYNIYEWCGADSSYTISGYKDRTEEFSTYAKPAFFAEYGCNTPPRLFDDTPVLLGPQMDSTWSGGIVYMYFQTTNNYGLVEVNDNSVSTLPAFNAYSSQIAKASPTGPAMSDYNPTNTPWACPTTGASWAAAATPLPPTPNADACSCLYNSLGCVVKSSVSQSRYGKEFGYVCGLTGGYCDGIAANGTTGDYGAWSMCSAEQQLAYVYNEFYQANSGKDGASACDFGGSAQTTSAQQPSGSCSSLIAQAGSAGTGTVTAAPQGTGDASSPNGSSSGSSSSSSGSGAIRVASHPETGFLPAAVMVALACVSGMGIIFL